uniref:EGF-like domain-containing protein n=1 Tax=Xiphophorus maculatus TaxID=8083 RepID=A0A3B5PUQ7_XIPMA
NGTKLCQCSTQFTGHQCELDKCQFCGDGKCFTQRTGEIACKLVSLLTCVFSQRAADHHRMTNGAMNVEIGNPAYKIYEGDPDDDAGELLDSDFTLDPDKPTNFTNPVYATLYMGAHNSRNSLASTDEKKELLSQTDEDMNDPLA